MALVEHIVQSFAEQVSHYINLAAMKKYLLHALFLAGSIAIPLSAAELISINNVTHIEAGLNDGDCLHQVVDKGATNNSHRGFISRFSRNSNVSAAHSSGSSSMKRFVVSGIKS